MTASENEGHKIVKKDGGRSVITWVDGALKVSRLLSLDTEYLKDSLSVSFRLIRSGQMKDLQRLVNIYGMPKELVVFIEDVEIDDIIKASKELERRSFWLESMRKSIQNIINELDGEEKKMSNIKLL
jgi:hypothetical protein